MKTWKILFFLSLKVKDYSYHRVIWKDMDGDGDLDAVTARFHNSKINSWLKEIKKKR